MLHSSLLGVSAVLAISVAHARMPDSIAAPEQVSVAQFHAEGAQIYECKSDAMGKQTWQFREPVATLLADGQTVGRHYAGPSWQLNDGSVITARVASTAPGATPADIAWLRLDVTHSDGRFGRVITVQRIDTKGGVAPPTCSIVGSYLSVPYSAEYVFLHRE